MNKSEKKTYIRLGFIFVIIGFLFGIDSYFKWHVVYKLWPLLILIQGCGFIIVFIKRRFKAILYLIMGAYLSLFSILALYFNFTSWKKIGYTWPLFITFLGSTLISTSFFNRSRFTLFLGIFFVFLSGFFFLIIAYGLQIWWSIFILIGLSIILTIKSK